MPKKKEFIGLTVSNFYQSGDKVNTWGLVDVEWGPATYKNGLFIGSENKLYVSDQVPWQEISATLNRQDRKDIVCFNLDCSWKRTEIEPKKKHESKEKKAADAQSSSDEKSEKKSEKKEKAKRTRTEAKEAKTDTKDKPKKQRKKE